MIISELVCFYLVMQRERERERERERDVSKYSSVEIFACICVKWGIVTSCFAHKYEEIFALLPTSL